MNLMLAIRKKPLLRRGKKKVRPFRVPQINFEANSLYNVSLIPLKVSNTEPSISVEMSEGKLETLLASPLNLQLYFGSQRKGEDSHISCSSDSECRPKTRLYVFGADKVFQDGFSLKTKLVIYKI